MTYESSVHTSDPPDRVVERTEAYLTRLGYKRVDGPTFLTMRRGSIWGSLTAMKPQRLKTTVEIVADGGNEYTVRYNVNTTGQMVTDAERAYWLQEKESVGGTLVGHAAGTLDAAGTRVTSTNRRLVLGMVFGLTGAVAGLAVIVIVGLINSNLVKNLGVLPVVGAIAGGAIGARRTAKKEKEQ